MEFWNVRITVKAIETLLPHFLTVSPNDRSERRTAAEKRRKRTSMVILKMFAAIEKKKKARDGWKHQDVCLVILFFTAFHFERRKMRLKVQVIHIFPTHTNGFCG